MNHHFGIHVRLCKRIRNYSLRSEIRPLLRDSSVLDILSRLQFPSADKLPDPSMSRQDSGAGKDPLRMTRLQCGIECHPHQAPLSPRVILGGRAVLDSALLSVKPGYQDVRCLFRFQVPSEKHLCYHLFERCIPCFEEHSSDPSRENPGPHLYFDNMIFVYNGIRIVQPDGMEAFFP